MSDRTDIGVQLNLAGPTQGGAGLTKDVYVGQPANVFHVGAASLVAIWIEATADGATAIASIEYKLQTSYDGTHWADVATDKSDGTSPGKVDQSFAVAAGATTYGWLQTSAARLSNHARVVAKASGGVTKSGDIAKATVKAA